MRKSLEERLRALPIQEDCSLEMTTFILDEATYIEEDSCAIRLSCSDKLPRREHTNGILITIPLGRIGGKCWLFH